MGIKGFIVRMLPFMGTFALGLFIASFFVNIGGTAACNKGRGPFHEMKRLRMENEDLRNENLRLRNEIENVDRSVSEFRHDLKWDAPSAPKRPLAPEPPRAPAAPRFAR